MATAYIKDIEYYVPENADVMPHGIDCDCNECQNAQNNRHGAYYNGYQWIEIL